MDSPLIEAARALMALCRTGCLCTNLHGMPGFPFGSMVPFALDPEGRPIFFLSRLAMHTQNLTRDPRASFLLVHPDAAEDPSAAPRLTLIGNVLPAPPEEVRDIYLALHKNAQAWQDFPDFAWYRLDPATAYFVGGFGAMGWLPRSALIPSSARSSE